MTEDELRAIDRYRIEKAIKCLDEAPLPSDVACFYNGEYYAPIQKDYILEFKTMFMSKAIGKVSE